MVYPTNCSGGFIVHDLFCQIKVTKCPLGGCIIQQNRLSETRGFAQSDISGNHGLEYQLLEIFFGIFSNLMRQICSFIKHGEKYAGNLKFRIQIILDALHGLKNLLQSVH